MTQTRTKKKQTMHSIWTDPTITMLEKKILLEKWKFNHLPDSYRKSRLKDYQQKIAQLIKEAEATTSEPKGGETKK